LAPQRKAISEDGRYKTSSQAEA